MEQQQWEDEECQASDLGSIKNLVLFNQFLPRQSESNRWNGREEHEEREELRSTTAARGRDKQEEIKGGLRGCLRHGRVEFYPGQLHIYILFMGSSSVFVLPRRQNIFTPTGAYPITLSHLPTIAIPHGSGKEPILGLRVGRKERQEKSFLLEKCPLLLLSQYYQLKTMKTPDRQSLLCPCCCI